ncbi:MAG: acyl-ACP--UDP-N-acetylglucosamine O-acyltransferase [Candidatus Hydrogenedentes bacterium]|nr:acyl-ACP--UDP-N-acetylglucosamine O-acyltransferase [Candidatus Hydrogenedentota bacterium]
MKIHPSAIVHPDAQLADDVEVQAFSIIGEHVRIGSGTVVGPHCVIDGRTTLGEGNRLYSGAQIGVRSQDLKHRDDLLGRAQIGDNNIFREHCSVSASTTASEEDDHRVTSIGNGCLLMSSSHVAHDCHVGHSVIIANCSLLAGHVTIQDHATLSGLIAVHQDCVVGMLSFVGGATRISKDVLPYMIVEGNPARCHGPNSVGLQRNGFDEAARKRIKELYRIMYRSKLNTTQALQEIEKSVEDCEERNRFLDFARKSVRGILK